MNRRWSLILLLVAIYLGWSNWTSRPVNVVMQGMQAPHAPLQENLSASMAPEFEQAGYRLQAQARYSLQARLLRKENYRFGREADLSPVDFALGWGPMSDSRQLEHINIKQSNRFYWLRWQDPGLSAGQIMENSANTHIIPATRAVASQVKAMREGQVVALEGYLVNVSAPDGWYWNTSLSRSDTGAGACELFWVESAYVVR